MCYKIMKEKTIEKKGLKFHERQKMNGQKQKNVGRELKR